MILAVNAGNSNILIGVYSEEKLICRCNISSKSKGTAYEMALNFKNILDFHDIKIDEIKGAIVSPVSYIFSDLICEGINILCGVKPLVVGPGIKTGLDIMTDDPSQLGGDIVACSVSAILKYGIPILIVIFGDTATTISVINEKGQHIGVIIMPGVKISLEALCKKGDQLPNISIRKPKNIIGRNSIESMESGAIYGTATMVSGMIDKIEKELDNKNMKVVVTGELGKIICPILDKKAIYDPDLLLEGLHLLYNKSAVSQKRK